jgi:hypothetical protein
LFSSGQVVACTVTATDESGASATASASVTVENGRPEVSDVALSPTELHTNDTLTATPTVSDPDGDSFTVTYAFSVNGSVVQDGPADSLSGVLHFDKHDTVSVEVTADDGDGIGTRTSETLTVRNTPPTAPEVSIDASGDGLLCTIDSPSTDPDGDSVTYAFDWDVDGADFTDPGTTVLENDTVPEDSVETDATWTCDVTPDDGDDEGDYSTASLYLEAGEEPLDIPESEMSFDVLTVSGTLRDHDVSADGSARVLSIDGGTIYLNCFDPDGTDTLGAIEVGVYETWLSEFGSSFAVYMSRVSKNSLVVWRWQNETGSQELRYSYLDADCSIRTRERAVWSGDYVEFFDAAIDDRGRAVVAYGQGATRVGFIDSEGELIGTEVPFDIGAGYGTHVAMNQSTGAGIVASQTHSGDGIHYQRFDSDFAWIDSSPVHMPAGYHYWYDGYTVGMNDYNEFAFLWRSGGTTLEMAFYDADGTRIAEVERSTPDFESWGGGHCYDSFRLRHPEIPLHGDNFIFGEVYNWMAGTGLEVMHFEYTPEGDLVSADSTSHSVDEGLTIRTDGWGNATVRDDSSVTALYSYP